MAPARRTVLVATAEAPPEGGARCCPHLHEAVELVGKRWTGAIVAVLLDAERPMRFTEIAQAIPHMSDRLLSERMTELESRGPSAYGGVVPDELLDAFEMRSAAF